MNKIRERWFLYNHGVLQNTAPHIPVESTDKVQEILKYMGGAFCRWTSDFDCGKETKWWYCIRDEKVELANFSTKQRYRINHGSKNCEVTLLEPEEVEKSVGDLFNVQVEAFKEYPEKYRPRTDKSSFHNYIMNWTKSADIWLVRDKNSSLVCGYAICKPQDEMVHLTVVKVIPQYLKNDVNAILAFEICKYYLNERNLKYVCDGERNIRHETNYQDFLVKNLNFRYAYCQLHIVYRPVVKFAIFILFPFRKLLKRLAKTQPFIYNVYCMLKQEEIAKTFR